MTSKSPMSPMTLAAVKNTFLAAALALVAAGCGSSATSAPRASQTALVGAAGATLKAGAVTVTIPAGALASSVQVTVREAEPHHAGAAARVELEPNDLPLAAAALVSVQVDDRNGHVKMLDDAGRLVQVELEDPNHHSYKTTMDHLGSIEVEVEHGVACATACAANEECDDGVCKAHVEDAAAAACSPVCASGLECDDGACKPHGGGVDPAPGTTPAPAACAPTCATGLECDDGICKPHKAG
jgi:hypothetical protein